MAVLQITPRDEALQRVESLTGVARLVLDVRIVTVVAALAWLALRPDRSIPLLAGAGLGLAWLVLVLSRWHTVGWVLCTHPTVLALDATVCFAGAGAGAGAVSPMVLPVGAGALFAGVCLDRRGARYFSPLYIAGWWLVFSMRAPDRADTADVFWQLLGVPSMLVGVLFLGAGIRSVVLHGADAERRLRAETRAAGVAEERARMAREMHDSLTKSMHGLALLADSLPGWIARSPDRATEQCRKLADLIRGAGQESRALILAMRRADARSTVADQVATTVSRWRSTSGHPAELEVQGAPVLPTESSYELVAILGEALENVRRHTEEGTAVRVCLEEGEAWVGLRVGDDGPGIPPEHANGREGHFGIVGMHERAARVGGRLEVSSRAGSGTVVQVHLPASLEDNADAERAVGARE